MMMPIKRHTIVSTAVIYPSLKLEHVIYRPLDTAKSIGRRPRRTWNAISRKTNETRRIAAQYINSWRGVEAMPTVVCILLLPLVSLQKLSLLLNNAINVLDIYNKILFGIKR